MTTVTIQFCGEYGEPEKVVTRQGKTFHDIVRSIEIQFRMKRYPQYLLAIVENDKLYCEIPNPNFEE